MSGVASQKVRSFFDCLSSDVMCSTIFYHIEKVSHFFKCLKSLHLDLSLIRRKDLHVPLITDGSKSKKFSQAIERHLKFSILTERKPRNGKYMICGSNFIQDLLGLINILKPVVDLMLRIQSLHCPVWKLKKYWPRRNL